MRCRKTKEAFCNIYFLWYSESLIKTFVWIRDIRSYWYPEFPRWVQPSSSPLRTCPCGQRSWCCRASHCPRNYHSSNTRQTDHWSSGPSRALRKIFWLFYLGIIFSKRSSREREYNYLTICVLRTLPLKIHLHMNQIWIAENTYRGKNSMLKKLVNFFLLEFS